MKIFQVTENGSCAYHAFFIREAALRPTNADREDLVFDGNDCSSSGNRYFR